MVPITPAPISKAVVAKQFLGSMSKKLFALAVVLELIVQLIDA